MVRAPAPEPAPETRVAVIAGRRVGGAVQRNRAKRRLREALRQVTLPESEHLAVIASRSVLDAPFPELVSWLADTLAAEVAA